ncbi:hypothetical protein GPJ56_003439 [Histomonas meleagridis]|uniref:uncharacterized protein n=1 Tax=Histomonas meleagridis TaxID=135588 RepID=UPI0035594A84|nr:hypothetical protein GPJ56_003439 [Histomonas meleagridis]KAH0799131.1 hypothetical protein GO595_007928 [Histomonas meleagridis]
MEKSLIYLGVRKPVPFSFGSLYEIDVYREPQVKPPAFSQKYSEYLNSSSINALKPKHVGVAYDNEVFYQHIQTRNRLIFNQNILFEAFDSSIKIIENPSEEGSWVQTVPTISTRSKCRALAISPDSSFGVALTLANPVIFSTVRSPNLRFSNVQFFSLNNINPTDVAINPFIPNEFVISSDDNSIYLYDQTNEIACFSHEINEKNIFNSTIFLGHPRVASLSLHKSVCIIDFRTPQLNIAEAPFEKVTSMATVSPIEFVTASADGLNIVDIRLPTKACGRFRYNFASPPVHLSHSVINNFICISALIRDTSDVIYFPFNQTEYAAPFTPFDIKFKDFYSLESEFLTGFTQINDHAYLQFEGGAILHSQLSNEHRSSIHFLSSIMRSQDHFQRDIFDFEPQFEKIRSRNRPDDGDVQWNAIMPGATAEPPASLLYKPEINENDETDAVGYLIEDEEALDLLQESVPEALGLFWKSHIMAVKEFMENKVQ